VRATLRGALSDVVQQGNLQPNVEYLEYSERLAALARKNSRMKYAWLATCGTMANENALKICRQKKTGARMILTFKNAFAGRSTMMTEITDNPSFKVGIPDYNEVLRLPFYDPKVPKDTTLNVLKEHVAKHEGKSAASRLSRCSAKAATARLRMSSSCRCWNFAKAKAFRFGPTRFRPLRAREISLHMKLSA